MANLLEAMRWTDYLARAAAPLSRAAHLNQASASAFALAFASPASANALLSENYERGAISMRELMLANLFNSLPAWLSHAPTIFLLTWPVLGMAAIDYTGITLLAAIGRTAFTILAARLLLPAKAIAEAAPSAPAPLAMRLRAGMQKAWRRFLKRAPKLILFASPVYALMFLGQQGGFFQSMEHFMAENLAWISFLKPQAMGIIAMQLMAEMGAALGAAGAALADGGLTAKDIVIAMLCGNVLATPLRAIRHQLPSYAGLYRPAIALKLVLANQALRAASMIILIAIYIWL